MKAMFSLVVLLALTSCASHKTEKEIEQKAAESKVSDGKALGTTIHDLIEQSQTLTAEQKSELTNIMKVNKETADALTEQSFKFRSVLITELLSGKVDKKKIKLIKKDIKEIEAKKLKNTFDTVEKISAIVSSHPDNSKYVDPLIHIEQNRR